MVPQHENSSEFNYSQGTETSPLENVMRIITTLIFAVSLLKSALAEPVHVLVWDERQPRQKQAYDNWLGNEIAERLKATASDFEVRSVSIDDPNQGLEDSTLDWADVIIWWGHVRQNEVKDDHANAILDRIRDGKLSLIALHSAHWARPFTYAMNWRSIEDAKESLQDLTKGKRLTIEAVKPPREFTVPIHGTLRTPAVFGYKENRENWKAIVHLPYCCFPDYRPDGAPSTVTVKMPDHPIARGIGKSFRVPHTEMYNEPFHVPEPDQIVFEETWEPGERFRSGMIWNIGQGRVFYFRPGHETYDVYKEPVVIRILENACNWLGR